MTGKKKSDKKKVIVLGGGFGGVFAAKSLEKLGRGAVEVELINNNNYFVFQPLLAEVASGSINSSDAVVPLRQLLTRVQVRQARVMGIDFAKKKAIVMQGTARSGALPPTGTARSPAWPGRRTRRASTRRSTTRPRSACTGSTSRKARSTR
jgi:hypothetical protein